MPVTVFVVSTLVTPTLCCHQY